MKKKKPLGRRLFKALRRWYRRARRSLLLLLALLALLAWQVTACQQCISIVVSF